MVKHDRNTRRTSAKREYDELKAERRETVVLPKPGETGPAALRTPGRFRLPRHQDTSATLAGAYPFLAEGGLGSEGVFVGQDLYSGSSFVYDPWILYARGLITAPNLVLAGIVGSGKSSLAKSLYTRSIPFGRRVYVPGDPKGEHTPVAEAVGGRAIALGHGMANRLNPLDEGHRPSGLDDAQWCSQIASRRRDLVGALAETVLERRLTPLEHTAVTEAKARLRDWVAICGTRLDRDRPTRQTSWPGETAEHSSGEVEIFDRDQDFEVFVLDDLRQRRRIEALVAEQLTA